MPYQHSEALQVMLLKPARMFLQSCRFHPWFLWFVAWCWLRNSRAKCSQPLADGLPANQQTNSLIQQQAHSHLSTPRCKDAHVVLPNSRLPRMRMRQLGYNLETGWYSWFNKLCKYHNWNRLFICFYDFNFQETQILCHVQVRSDSLLICNCGFATVNETQCLGSTCAILALPGTLGCDWQMWSPEEPFPIFLSNTARSSYECHE